MKKYDLTLADYNVIFEQQGGICAICGQPELATAGFGVPKSLAVDHNHETGQVRGLLCSACNIGLGCMKDDPNILAKAIAYLTQETDR